MLRAIVVGGNTGLLGMLETVFNATERFVALRSLDNYPDARTMEGLLRAHAPQVVFVGIDDLTQALAAKIDIERTVPSMPIVAFGRGGDQKALLELMKIGIREFLPLPIEASHVLELADRVEEHLRKNPLAIEATDLMFSFLPAKPGVGTSTLALNISVALSRQPDTKVLLTDFDLNSGLISFMLKLNSTYSIVDAVNRWEDLDENLWPQLVTELDELHVIPSSRGEPGSRIEPVQIHQMLSFARRHYDVICADLSGNLEKYSIELMLESKRIFVVTTPEIPPLHLARERLRFLRELDLGDRASVLLNRWTRRSAVTLSQIEDLLDVPVYESFPNNYTEVHNSLIQGRPVAESSNLGEGFTNLARRIMTAGSAEPVKVQPKKRFFETFSIRSSK